MVDHAIEGTCEYFLAENTISLIDSFKKEDKPFFIWHNTWGPHGAYICHRSFYDMYRDVEIPQPENFGVDEADVFLPSMVKRLHGDKPWSYFAEHYRYYFALTTQIDAMLGRILEHLDKSGIGDNTVIMFTSDHGSHFGMHGGLVDKGFSHYEEAQRTGCIIFDPRDKTQRVFKEYTSLLDIYPTILDFAGVEPPKEIDGDSLLKLVRGETESWRDHAFVEFYGLGNIITTMLTIVYDNFKYGWNPSNCDELYSLEDDPLQKSNQISNPNYKNGLMAIREKMLEHLQMHNNPLQYIFQINVLQKHYPEKWGCIPS